MEEEDGLEKADSGGLTWEAGFLRVCGFCPDTPGQLVKKPLDTSRTYANHHITHFIPVDKSAHTPTQAGNMRDVHKLFS